MKAIGRNGGGGGAGTTIKAGILSRVSTAMQVERVSLDQQETAGRQKAEQLSRDFGRPVEVVKVYRGAGISGDGEERPELTDALADMKAGAIGLLIAYDVDRLTRDVRQLLSVFGAVSDAGGRIEFCLSPLRYDEETNQVSEDDELMLLIRGWFAGRERKTFLRRTKEGRNGNVAKGIQTQRGHDPYGYHIWRHWEATAGRCDASNVGRYTIAPEQAEVILRVASRLLTDRPSIRSLCRWLQDDLRIPAPGSDPAKGIIQRTWYPSTLRKILSDTLYKGEARYGRKTNVRPRGDEMAERLRSGRKRCHMVPTDPSAWVYLDAPAILTPEAWQAINDILSANKQNKSGPPERRRLLSSFLRCPSCGGSMTGTRSGYEGKRCPYYTCSRAHDGGIQAKDAGTATKCPWTHLVRGEVIEARFLAAIGEMVQRPDVIETAIMDYIDARAAALSSGSVLRERADLTKERSAAQKTAAALSAALVMSVEDGADDATLSGLRDRQRANARALASIDTRLAALPEPGKIADALPTPGQARATVTGCLRRMPEALADPTMTVSEKRWLLESAVESIALIGIGERATPFETRDWGCEVVLRAEVWGGRMLPQVGAQVAGGEVSVSFTQIKRTDTGVNVPSLRIRSTAEGVRCYVA